MKFHIPMIALLLTLVLAGQSATGQTIDEIQVYDSNGVPASPYAGSIVEVEGIIIERGQYSSGSHYILDDTGAGLSIYQSGSTVEIGDRVTATGTVGSFSGEIQLGTVSFDLISTGNSFYPEVMTVSQVLSTYENVGRFVWVTGTVTSKPDASNFFMTDGNSELLIYIDSTTGIDLGAVDVGDLYQVVAPVVNYNTTIQLKPRFQADLVENPTQSGGMSIVLQGDNTISCEGTAALDFNYMPESGASGVKGYSIRVVADDAVAFSSADFAVNTLPPGDQGFYQVIENGPNDFTVDYVILGSDTGGIVTAETLFTLTVHGQLEGQALVSIAEAEFRDLDNLSMPVDYSATAMVVVDCGPPSMVGDVSLLGGHEQISLAWTDPPEAGLVEVKVLRACWHDESGISAYPGYGQVAGSAQPSQFANLEEYLASPEWTLVSIFPPGVGQFIDSISERGIYFYQLFGVDGAGNASVPLEQSPCTMNYVLGDVALPYDGLVDVSDITVLGDSYGEACGDTYYNGEADIGPTEDGSGTAIPLPDCQVGFEDLMIFSFTFGGQKSLDVPGQQCGRVVLSWASVSEGIWSLSLVEPCPSLKGIHLLDQVSGQGRITLERGALLDRQAGPIILEQAGGAELDIALVCLGAGQGLAGTGELFRVIAGEANLELTPVFEARGLSNEPLEIELQGSASQTLPRQIALGHNFPNPFNPSTSISFSLPRDQQVKLAVYSLDGRLLRTLLNETRTAGVHEVVWDGLDDRGRQVASGVYFCRLESGTFTAMEKMVLMK